MLLIDTYNCLYAGAAMGGAMADLTVLRLCKFLDQTGQHGATLVLDGRPKPHEPSENECPNIRLVYSGTGITADKIILQIVKKHSAKRSLIVVSNDREVTGNAARLGARTMACEPFLIRLLQGQRIQKQQQQASLPAEKVQGSPTEGQTDYWLETFGFEAPEKPSSPSSSADPDDPDSLDIRSLLGDP